MDLKETILKFADDVQADMVACRRDLHAHPEPGWTEFRTAAKVAKTLAELGYTVKTGADTIREDAMMGVPSAEKLAKEQQRAIAEGADPDWVKKMDGGRTGVLGVMQFSEDGPVVAVRFDMDSNDVTETAEAAHRANKEGFASCHAGAMHACGHDGHTTVGLALARLLASLKSELRGTIKLCFQPAEEGVRGAHAMVESGIVDDVDYMLGAHFGFKMRKTGTVACNVTGFLATSKYDAHFQGVPAHAGAAPEQGKNALLAAARVEPADIDARSAGGMARDGVQVERGAGSGRNVIGDKALICLETRGATSAINAFMETEAQRILKAAAMMYDVDVTIEKVGGAAGGSNSPELAAFLEKEANSLGIFEEVVGECPFGASEDFSYFMERVQSHGGQAAYMMVGADLAAGHHDSHFDFDERALGYSLKLMGCAVCKLLLSK